MVHAESAVVLKIMPGGQHECVMCNFRTILLSNLNFIGLSLRKGDFTGHRVERTLELYIKVPGWVFSPYDARVNSAADEYPSLVLDVEASESPDQLRQDARWWYANTKQETKLVFIDVTTDDPHRVVLRFGLGSLTSPLSIQPEIVQQESSSITIGV